jgi:hypothetical protein
VRLIELRIDGFGKLADRTIAFDPGVNVVSGPNEAGKSTLAQAIVATLYGHRRGKREIWKPWSGARYATRLRYALRDGREFEIQRDFEQDGRNARLIDRNGNDITADCSSGRTFAPADAHLGIPLEVFLSASCVEQGAVAIEGARAERIGEALRHALDGGPKDDAALGAVARLDKALATHVGTKRATKNAPLRKLHEQLAEAEAQAADMRERLGRLSELRARLATGRVRLTEVRESLEENERRRRAHRAYLVRARLEKLRGVRAEIAELQAERALYDDVRAFPNERVAELEVAYATWSERSLQAAEAAREVARAQLTDADLSELTERARDGGALDDASFAELEAASRSAAEAHAKAAAAIEGVVALRRDAQRGRSLDGTLAGIGLAALAGASWLGYRQLWIPAALAALIALALLGVSVRSMRARGKMRRTAIELQQVADDAADEERRAAARMQAILVPLGIPSVDEFRIDELRALRHRYRELRLRADDCTRACERAEEAARRRNDAAAAFDALARIFEPGDLTHEAASEITSEAARYVTNEATHEVTSDSMREAACGAARKAERDASREASLARACLRAARKSTRDGIESRLQMLNVQRANALGGEDEYALGRELSELLSAGTTPVPIPEGVTLRSIEEERAALERSRNETQTFTIQAAAQIEAAETHIGSLAESDERSAALRTECARLAAFEAAVGLARTTIEEQTRASHDKFARRLEEYALHTLGEVTNRRYGEIFVDPATLTIRARVPETGAIVDLERLSSGTREQVLLVVRLAMARMFGEGFEPAPLLLDDPFAYWDDDRIARGFPILRAAAAEAQTIVFTTSRELAGAAQTNGAHRIDLAASPELVR